MERNVKHLLLRKTDFLETSIFSERKFEEMPQPWRAKRHKLYSGKRLYVFRLQNHVSDFFQVVLFER